MCGNGVLIGLAEVFTAEAGERTLKDHQLAKRRLCVVDHIYVMNLIAIVIELLLVPRIHLIVHQVI
jgi:hypothetical protein